MTLALLNLIIGSTLGFFLASFIYLCVDDFKNVFLLIPILAFMFGLHKYIRHNKYIKKKDTYEYIEKLYFGKIVPLAETLNKRMDYFDHFFNLSVEERLSHKIDVQQIHRLLADLNSRIEHNLFDRDVLSTYLNENFKNTLVNLILHFDITFLAHPHEIMMLYKNLFDDFDQFYEKINNQQKYFIEYHNKNIVNTVEIEIENEKNTLNGWVQKTNLASGDCSNREILLHQLQILKSLYPNYVGFYLSLGNLFYMCFFDYERSVKFLEKAIQLDTNCVEAYKSLMAVEYQESKKIDSALQVLNKAPKDLINDDQLLLGKALIYLEERMYGKCEETAKQIKNETLKNKVLDQLNRRQK